MSDFFGSDDQTQTSTTTQTSDPWGPTKKPLKNFINEAADLGLAPAEFFPGQTFLDMTPGQRNILQNQNQIIKGYGENVVDPSFGAWQNQLAGPDSAVWDNAYNKFAENTMENFNRHVLPGINDAFTATGGRKSSRAGIAEGMAMENVMDSISDAGANLQLGFQDMANKNQRYALGLTPDVMNWGIQPGNLQYQVKDALQQDEQNQLQEDISRYNFDNLGGQFTNIDRAFPYIFNPANAFKTTTGEQTTTVSGGGASPFEQILGAGMTVAGMASGNPFAMAGGSMMPTGGNIGIQTAAKMGSAYNPSAWFGGTYYG